MRVAVLGGSRFVGFRVAHIAANAGAAVTLLNRGRTRPPGPLPSSAAHVVADREDPSHAAALPGTFDVVFDFSGHHPRHIEPFIAPEGRARISHYVFCSTSSVYRVPPPCPHDEGAPRRLDPGTYGGDKARAEDLLLDAHRRHGWPVTIVRPQGIFGALDPAAAGFIFSRLAHDLPVFLGPNADCRLNPLHIDDFGAALLRIAASPASHGRVYNVAGNDAVSLRELVRLCGDVSGRAAHTVTPSDWRHHFVDIGPPWLSHDLVADTSAIRRELGVEFRPLHRALHELWQTLQEDPKVLRPQLLAGERDLQAGRRVRLRLVASGLRRAAGRSGWRPSFRTR